MFVTTYLGKKYYYNSLWLFWRRLKSRNSRQVVSDCPDIVPATFLWGPLRFFYYWNEIQCLPPLGENFQNGAQGSFISYILHIKTLWNSSEFLIRTKVPSRSNHKFWCSWKWHQLLHHYARNRIPEVRLTILWYQIMIRWSEDTTRRSGAIFQIRNLKSDEKGRFVICKKKKN